LVKEGDHIKKGDKLLLQENVQANADVQAQSATIISAESAVQGSGSQLQGSAVGPCDATSDLRSEAGFLTADRALQGWPDRQAGIRPAQDRIRWSGGVGGFGKGADAVAEGATRSDALTSESDQSSAGKSKGRFAKDRLHFTDQRNRELPAGAAWRYVVPGIQNSNGSFLMTLSDMSVVTAEVKVDETDIVNVKMGQEADVTIDAVPGKIFKGKVTESVRKPCCAAPG